MRQCLLEKDGVQQVAWIDVTSADQGLYVDLKIDGGYDKDWRIVTVSESQMDAETVKKRGQDYRNHRKATDI